ncbi:MAG: DUF6390 family protein [Candidatus Anstonellaceae archaeon]
MEGAELSARFALPPNSRSYCGDRTFAEIFAAYLDGNSKRNLPALRKSLQSFRAHYAYLELIANANSRSPFDYEVSEALWIGNRLLENVEKLEMQRVILERFCGHGMLSKENAKRLAEEMPDGFVPHHSFHVLYLHTITGVIEPSVKNADLCRPSWGSVSSVDGETAVVKSQKLARLDGKLVLQECRKKVRTACAGMALLPDLRKGERVAFHWGVGVMKISQQQAERLEKYTERNIAAANREAGE